jgi:hypothetical protein
MQLPKKLPSFIVIANYFILPSFVFIKAWCFHENTLAILSFLLLLAENPVAGISSSVACVSVA